jgi:hypothetical protein
LTVTINFDHNLGAKFNCFFESCDHRAAHAFVLTVSDQSDAFVLQSGVRYDVRGGIGRSIIYDNNMLDIRRKVPYDGLDIPLNTIGGNNGRDAKFTEIHIKIVPEAGGLSILCGGKFSYPNFSYYTI